MTTIYLAVMAAFGTVHSPWAILALPAGVLTGMAFAAPMAAFSATQDKDVAFSTVYRFIVIPLFLFSGTFFPISQLPRLLQYLAYVTPLYHGVALCRDLTLGSGQPWVDVGHAAYLALWVGVGLRALPADLRRPAGRMSTTGAEPRRREHRGVALRITPLALLGGRHAVRVLERNILVYRRSWIFIVSGFFEPLFYLLSIGVGLSHLVGPISVDGRLVPYTAFVAPGLLAASAMNGAMLDSTFLVFMKLKIAKTYDAMLATPLAVGDIAVGELSWCVLRGALYSGAFLCIMTLLGYDQLPLGHLLLARCHPHHPGLRRRRHGRDHLHALLAGLRHRLAGLHPPLPLLGHVLSPDRVPGMAAGRGAVHAPLPRGGDRTGGRSGYLRLVAARSMWSTWRRWRSAAIMVTRRRLGRLLLP